MEAQARRAVGAGQRDVGQLTAALHLFEQTGAIPYAARTRCERALLTGDNAELEGGLLVLEHLGDVEQIGRIQVRRTHSSDPTF